MSINIYKHLFMNIYKPPGLKIAFILALPSGSGSPRFTQELPAALPEIARRPLPSLLTLGETHGAMEKGHRNSGFNGNL